MSIITKPSTPEYREGWTRIFGVPVRWSDIEESVNGGSVELETNPDEVNI
jgi:hypothetical protein